MESRYFSVDFFRDTAVIDYCFVFFSFHRMPLLALQLLFVPGRHPLPNPIWDGVFPAARPLQMPLQYESGRPMLGIIIEAKTRVR